MNRRNFIVVSLSALAAFTAVVTTRILGKSHDSQATASNAGFKKNKAAINTHYFSTQQYALVAILASYIVPSDDTPGATEAKVVDFIDREVATSTKKQKTYSKGLKRLDVYSKKNYGNDFISLSNKQQYQIIDDTFNSYYQRNQKADGIFNKIQRKVYRLWDNKFNVGGHVKFFGELRRDTLEGFYSSPVGWKVAGYYGPPQPLGYPDFNSAPVKSKDIKSDQHILNGNQPDTKKA